MCSGIFNLSSTDAMLVGTDIPYVKGFKWAKAPNDFLHLSAYLQA